MRVFEQMTITFKLYAGLSEYLPEGATRNSTQIELQPGDTVNQVIDRCQVPRDLAHLVMLNGIYLATDQRDQSQLKTGDTLAIWPPVAGG